ncbi:hypothetical protein PR048_005449 [Dryococelus australis]|uniref:Uncharacterized protein n=1 Tax=Dryococelus australis TaxID=614101 RepID=A0ABQ9IAE3_9NEOP|nr:hypothetical protein PR048_005449 [Dryococelus australis]
MICHVIQNTKYTTSLYMFRRFYAIPVKKEVGLEKLNLPSQNHTGISHCQKNTGSYVSNGDVYYIIHTPTGEKHLMVVPKYSVH